MKQLDQKVGDSRNNVIFNHVIIFEGKAAGTRKRELTKAHVTIEAKPFVAVNAIKDEKLRQPSSVTALFWAWTRTRR